MRTALILVTPLAFASGVQIDAGVLAPLQDAYDQYIWPKLKEGNLDFTSKGAWSSVRFGGELYAIPEVWGRNGGEANAFTWVRSDWLENLGLTYGMVLNRDNWGMPGGLEPFFNAHHAYPNIWIEDGQAASYSAPCSRR